MAPRGATCQGRGSHRGASAVRPPCIIAPRTGTSKYRGSNSTKGRLREDEGDPAAHGIVLRDEESFIVESTATFPRAEKAQAIRTSFLVSVVFFNERLRDAMKARA